MLVVIVHVVNAVRDENGNLPDELKCTDESD